LVFQLLNNVQICFLRGEQADARRGFHIKSAIFPRLVQACLQGSHAQSLQIALQIVSWANYCVKRLSREFYMEGGFLYRFVAQSRFQFSQCWKIFYLSDNFQGFHGIALGNFHFKRVAGMDGKRGQVGAILRDAIERRLEFRAKRAQRLKRMGSRRNHAVVAEKRLQVFFGSLLAMVANYSVVFAIRAIKYERAVKVRIGKIEPFENRLNVH